MIFRNPKDTAVSFFHFHNDVPDIPSYGSWDEFFRQFMKGQGIAVGKRILTSTDDHIKYKKSNVFYSKERKKIKEDPGTKKLFLNEAL